MGIAPDRREQGVLGRVVVSERGVEVESDLAAISQLQDVAITAEAHPRQLALPHAVGRGPASEGSHGV